MIRHLVLFTLRPEIDVADREWLFSQIRGLAHITVVRNLALGQCLQPAEDWYRGRISSEFEYGLTMEFENEAALYAYQTHPDHVTVGQEIRKRTSTLKVFDFVTQEQR